jgi:hypothetical protein
MDHLLSLEKDGKSLARNILENSARHYGFRTLEEAEAETKARVDGAGIQASFVCEGGDNRPLQL